MSDESCTRLYKGAVTSKVGNETVLGTPVPVAHSTVGYDELSGNHKRSRNHLNAMQQTSPAFEKQTYVINPFSRNKSNDVPNSNNEELSILNIDTIKGLSDSVLDRSLQDLKYNQISKKLSLGNRNKQIDTFKVEHCQSIANLSTDMEAEQKIQFDDEELKMLEEAFSDFDCEASEATAPSRVCETFARRVSCELVEVDEQYSNGNSTSVPSLSSNEGICDVDGSNIVDLVNPSVSTHSCNIPQTTELPTLIPECHSKNTTENQANSSKNTCSQSVLRPQNKNYSHLPCLTGLSSVFEVDSNETKSDNCVQPNLYSTTTSPLKLNQTLTVSPVPTLISHSLKCINSEPIQSMDINNNLSTEAQVTKQNLSSKSLHPSQKINDLIDTSSLKLRNLNLNQSDISHVDISCLHMSDIDSLLDMITGIGKQPNGGKLESVSRHNKLSSHLEKQLEAVRQALRSNIPSNTVDFNKIPTGINGKRPNFSQSKVDALKENIPPTNITSSGQDVTHRKRLSHHPNPDVSHVSRNLPIKSHSINATNENPSVHDGSIISQKDSFSPEVLKSQNVPILSNTNCLIWAGAVCGQIHRQHFLIKHQMEKPTTISFVVHPKSEVFKLVDENGYLITGIFRVYLPPNLEYEVNVAYVAKHPVSWDFGHLLLRSEESKTSTFKVRLIGYTNSSELVYSCCSKLSSNVYWTVASKIDPSSESVVKYNEESYETSLRSAKYELTSNVSGCSLASINISNFGSRSAWVCARVEWVDRKAASQNEHEDTSECGVIIEPKALVIGSKQSQSIFITLKHDVNAVRIVFYHGDEVVRYQFRRLCACSEEIISKLGKRSSHSRKDNRLRLSEILKDFEYEQSIQIVELPPASFSDLRPQDWHQAFADQVHHCERMFLYIYTSKQDRNSCTPNQPSVYLPSSVSESVLENSLASVFVQQDAFKRQNSLNPIHRESSATFLSKPISRKGSLRETYPTNILTPNFSTGESSKEKMSLFQMPKLEINPPYTLVFPPCTPSCSTEAQFSVSLKQSSLCEDETSLSLWKVFWSANPVTDIQLKNITSNSSYSLSKRSTMEQGIFQLLPSKSNSLNQHSINNKSVNNVGILSTNANDTEFRSFLIPFHFKPTSYCENILIQDWHLDFWLEPCIQKQCHFISKSTLKDSVTLLVTLEGSCQEQATFKESPLTHLQCTGNYKSKYPPPKSHCFNDRTSLMIVENTSKTVHIGPIDVIGLPVSFDTIDSNSSITARSHNIMLINRMKTTEAFVRLKLPSPPFYVIEPKEMGFRIPPRSRVRIVLNFRPYTLGKSSSVLGISVEYHKQENLSVEKPNFNVKPTIDSFQVHLFGTMN
ncbi:hypothetical protein Smp_028050 [Schistosoma mansoni]|uniref:Pecanex-like protein n=1 Tax=Schistosoma mansoni TaxID=6183 RepID=G4V632_SCHMA|nr:hypothetical protein Smp_028050 [Schistosoma mansoni]|eukprot:XP_018648587.1 hypothetical protein Smp_028050 [Schistosoma mansoni]